MHLTLDAPAPSHAPTLVPAPRTTASRAGAPSFASMLTAARTEDDWTQLGAMSIDKVLKLIMLLELFGASIPPELIRVLRAHGMTAMADSLELRNQHIEEDGEQGRAKLRRALELLATRAAA
jgi:hypothetical protein